MDATTPGQLSPDDPFADTVSTSQRALELRKFFQPFDPLSPREFRSEYLQSLDRDGALDSYAELVLWQCKGARAMISLLDLTTQYFLAGAARSPGSGEIEISGDHTWFGCNTVSTYGGLCQWTVAETHGDESNCFTVPDLSLDRRFCDLPVVSGEVASFKFYAGTAITTQNGINIGTVFIFDNKPRPGGLTTVEKKHLNRAATNVMRHLEILRDAAERERVSRMGKGIATFLEQTSRVPEVIREDKAEATPPSDATNVSAGNVLTQTPAIESTTKESSAAPTADPTLDKIKMTMNHAAAILKDAFAIDDGGVIFCGTAVGYNQADNLPLHQPLDDDHVLADNRSRAISGPFLQAGSIKHKPVAILAMSYADTATSVPNSDSLDVKTLQNLINAYSNGHIFYFDHGEHFTSFDQEADHPESTRDSEEMKPRSSSFSTHIKGKRSTTVILSQVFPNARQIMFMPLWDVGGDRWHSGCFVWSQSAVPVFTVDNDLSFLTTYTNSVMAEISRLNSITANKIKSNFISSISHEFRSPLHGILASSELLRDSKLDSMQHEFVANIRSCSSILLDTINHVLDYSKINSFEKSRGVSGMLSNELYRSTNVALLCENTVNGIIAAAAFKPRKDSDSSDLEMGPAQKLAVDHQHVQVVMDFESRDWNFRIQPGAVQRILMNLFGNAWKYTERGFIKIQLRVAPGTLNGMKKSSRLSTLLIMNVKDSGKGISKEFLESKMFTPFAQEDTFAQGVGLGLSIVWSIVNQLGGNIQVGSEVGKGTDIEVTLPLDDPEICNTSNLDDHESEELLRTIKAQQTLVALRELQPKPCIVFWRNKKNSGNTTTVNSMEALCNSWFSFDVEHSTEEHVLRAADLVVVEQATIELDDKHLAERLKKVLVIREPGTETRWTQNQHVGNLWSPVGPYKFARSLSALLLGGGSTRSSVGQNSAIPVDRTVKGFQVEVKSPDSVISPLEYSPTFEIRLPIRQDDHQTTQGLEYFPRVPSSTEIPNLVPSTVAPLHILAVDDNALNLKLLTRQLYKRRIDIVHTATNGREAMELFQNAKEPIDLIFMDISMPEMDGFEATRLIRQRERKASYTVRFDAYEERTAMGDDATDQKKSVNRNLRPAAYIVALTGLASLRDRNEADESGFDEFLTKPISFKRIGELVEKRSRAKAAEEAKYSRDRFISS